jgi:hypothetical protein
VRFNLRGNGSVRRVLYTVAELGRMAGLSKHRTVNLLKANGVEIHTTGKQGKRVVLVSSLERGFPQLADSIRFRNGEDD